jgi:uncharacterized protein (TIRG00374 family)
MQNFRRNLIVTIVISALLYLAWVFWAGWEDIVQAFSQFEWWLLPVCLGLSLLNYAIRFCKWHYYLRILNISLDPRISFQIYMSGMVMAATPGKLGEVFKSYLLKSVSSTPISQSAPIILAERLTDFIAFLFLILMGITMLPRGYTVFGISLGIVIIILVLISWKWAAEGLIGIISRFPLIRNHGEKLWTAYESTYLLIAPKPLFLATIVSLFSWYFECVSFALILWGFDFPLPLVQTTFIYAFATIIGALFMTPGGLGPTEGTIGFLLMQVAKVPRDIAASSTLMIRACTLWFGVTVGLLVLTISSHNFHTLPTPEELDKVLEPASETK